MFERFTDRARRVVVVAQQEARAMGHSAIEVDHILLGLVADPFSVAARTLATLHVDEARIRAAIVQARGMGTPEALPRHIPFVMEAKKVMELSLREALQIGQNYIGTEHILLAILRVAEGRPQLEALLDALELNPAEVRKAVVGMLSSYVNLEIGKAVGERSSWVQRSRRKGKPDAASGPSCPKCSADLSATARYTTWDVPELNGKGSAPVLFLFCSGCGHTIDDVILPSE